ncbi:MAG: autotransporter outer membrane beta-barrel domain-containing protein, partial [Akkermansia sp.]|nr:autotransporter outer membrane beta-barrel domain-containing protein [Akkermansia sp.]
SHIVLGGGSKVHFRDGYTLGSGKTLEVAAPGAAYTGALTLGGGTLKLDGLLTVQGDVVFSAGTQTTIDLSGWNGVADGDVLATLGSSNSGYTEDSLTLSGIAGDWELDFDAADGTLTLVAVKDTPLPNPVFRPNLTRNQRATYGALKAIMAGGAPEGLLGELGREVVSTRDESKLKKLLNEMSGEEYTTMMSSQIEGNLAHLRRLRAAVGHATPQYGIGFYANAFHHDADVNSDAAGMGYQRSEWGAHFGAEGHIEKNTIWGLGLEKSRARVTPDGVARYHEEATRLDAYVRYEDGGWRIMGAFGMGEHRYDLRRRFSNGVAAEAENLDGSSVNMMAELAYSLHLAEQHTLQPFFVVESSYNKIDAFVEDGAGSASLRGADRTAWATDVTLGVRYVYGFAAVSGAPAASLTLHSGVVGSVGDTTADLNLRFCGADTQYVQRGADNNRWGYNVGMNVFVPLNDTMSVFGSAESILRGDTTQFDAQIGVRVAF